MKRLLIISNNVLSYTNNNGKTILSFIDGVKDLKVAQLYFSGEIPRVKKYRYYQMSDRDIINGMIDSSLRGKPVSAVEDMAVQDDYGIRNTVGRNEFTLTVREMIWWRKWKSKRLIAWLDSFKPDAVLFVAGDSIFAYSICDYIQKRFDCRLSVYVTDDYIMPRKDETLLHLIRRNIIKKNLCNVLKRASVFFTISEPMRLAYKKELNKDSYIALNMIEDLHDSSYEKKEKEIILSYAGSFYYGRSKVLGMLAKAISEYNKQNNVCPAKLMIYSNQNPSKSIMKELVIAGASQYGGSLLPEQLKERLNTSDILVFVESFDSYQIEKVKYSLSTKVPEYMSVGKPILAIGPKGIGSIDYLKDVSLSCSSPKRIKISINELVGNDNLRMKLAIMAREKYRVKHNRVALQKDFIKHVVGSFEDF